MSVHSMFTKFNVKNGIFMLQWIYCELERVRCGGFMHTLVVGLNYKTAPVEIREKLSFIERDLPNAMQALPAAAERPASQGMPRRQ